MEPTNTNHRGAWVQHHRDPRPDAQPAKPGPETKGGSSRFGLVPHYSMAQLGLRGGAGGIGCKVADLQRRGCDWASADFAPGDCLLFSSLCAHQGLPHLGDQLRKSAPLAATSNSQPPIATAG